MRAILYGYHKPIMIAGGMGNIRPQLVSKGAIPAGAAVIVLGGPAMLIGLGGGAASSQASGESAEDLDFASVQRENPEMQRRCQEVINHCNALGENTPILSIHDVGAGGISNALPEIIHDGGRGARLNCAKCRTTSRACRLCKSGATKRRSATSSPSILNPCRCSMNFAAANVALTPWSADATEEERLILSDELFNNSPIDIPMSLAVRQAAENAPRRGPA